MPSHNTRNIVIRFFITSDNHCSFYCNIFTFEDCSWVWHWVTKLLISLNACVHHFGLIFFFTTRLINCGQPTFWGLSWGKFVFGWEKTLKKMSELLSNSVFWDKSSMVRWKTLCRHLKRGQGHANSLLIEGYYSCRCNSSTNTPGIIRLLGIHKCEWFKLREITFRFASVVCCKCWLDERVVYLSSSKREEMLEFVFLYRCVCQHDTHQMWPIAHWAASLKQSYSNSLIALVLAWELLLSQSASYWTS